MGVNVELRKHRGTPSVRDKGDLIRIVVDADDRFARLIDVTYGSGKTPVLDRVDPYDYVIIGHADLTALLQDLLFALKAAAGDDLVLFGKDVERLVRAGIAGGPDHALHFVGD